MAVQYSSVDVYIVAKIRPPYAFKKYTGAVSSFPLCILNTLGSLLCLAVMRKQEVDSPIY